MGTKKPRQGHSHGDKCWDKYDACRLAREAAADRIMATLEEGRTFGIVSEVFCGHHAGFPYTEEELELPGCGGPSDCACDACEDGYELHDLCVFGVRLYQE